MYHCLAARDVYLRWDEWCSGTGELKIRLPGRLAYTSGHAQKYRTPVHATHLVLMEVGLQPSNPIHDVPAAVMAEVGPALRVLLRLNSLRRVGASLIGSRNEILEWHNFALTIVSTA